jgi:8-oxo-dGTP pyrophosphatase MutT (NUDIX family)/phosphohistidine phosphatase SixA
MTVFAAGALCWREVDGQLLIAIIHRKRYGDWSWPKGKVDPGESLPQAAVREIREETGLKVKLGVHLGTQNYMLQNGAAKEVHYWAAKVSDKALAESTFKPDEEVERIEWKTPKEIDDLLSYEQDKEFLVKLVDLHSKGLLQTKPFILLRHAKATPRNQWPKDEAHRPLLPLGEEQAKAIVPILAAYGIKKVVSSPWARCANTVMPYVRKKGLKLIERGQLTEFGNANGPQRTAKTVEKLLATGSAAVLCSHRPALPTILDTISKNATPAQEILIHEARALEPGQMLVVHLTKGEGSKRRIVGLEIQTPTVN